MHEFEKIQMKAIQDELELAMNEIVLIVANEMVEGESKLKYNSDAAIKKAVNVKLVNDPVAHEINKAVMELTKKITKEVIDDSRILVNGRAGEASKRINDSEDMNKLKNRFFELEFAFAANAKAETVPGQQRLKYPNDGLRKMAIAQTTNESEDIQKIRETLRDMTIALSTKKEQYFLAKVRYDRCRNEFKAYTSACEVIAGLSTEKSVDHYKKIWEILKDA